jgi:hypothetical protein
MFIVHRDESYIRTSPIGHPDDSRSLGAGS